MIYYSKTTNGFYTKEIHGTDVPTDCVQITEQQHASLLGEQTQGKQIVSDKNGYPIAIIPLNVFSTWEEIRVKRDFLLKNSDWSVAEDATPKPSKEVWLAYRNSLRNIPNLFKTPEEVVWPEKP